MTNKSKLDDINKNYFRAHKLWFKLIELNINSNNTQFLRMHL